MRVLLERDDQERLRWVIGVVIAAIGLFALVPLSIGAQHFALAAMAACAGALLFPALPARLPRRFWRALTPLIIVVVVVDFVLARGDILPPLVRMVVLLITLRAIEPRTTREDYQLIILSLLSVVVAGVLSLELSFLVNSLLFAPLAMVQLFLINLAESTPAHSHEVNDRWRDFGWVAFAARIVRCVDWRLAGFSAALFAIVTVFSTLLFYSLPRFEFGQSLSFLRFRASGSLTGFSESVRFGDVVSIQNDDSVALRVDLPAGAMADVDNLYWRMLVLDEFAEDGFRVSASALATAQKSESNLLTISSDVETDDAGDWICFFEGGLSKYLPHTGAFRQLQFQNRQSFAFSPLTRVLNVNEVQANKLVYRLEGVSMERALPALRGDEPLLARERPDASDPTVYPFTTTALPSDPVAREVFASYAAAIRGGIRGDDRGAFVESAIAALQQGRGYSMNIRVPEGEGGVLARWLSSDTPGHCELYAGALVLLCRAAGIPARMVVGYAGGDWNGFEDYLMVRNRHAHSWVEWFDPTHGWVRADPTPGWGANAAAAAAATDAAPQARSARAGDVSFAAYLDSLRMLWYRRVVNFDRAQQREMARSAQDLASALFAEMGARARGMLRAAGDLFAGRVNSGLLDWLYFGAAVAGLIFAVSRLRRMRNRACAGSIVSISPIRRRAGRWLGELRTASAGASVNGSPLQAELARVNGDLLALRFGPEGAVPDHRGVFRAARRLKRALQRA